MKPILVAGFSHQQVMPSLLPRCYDSRDAVLARLRAARDAGEIAGCVMLGTCNRLEVVVEPVVDRAGVPAIDGPRLVARLFAADAPAPASIATGDDAIRHLIRVAASLDSMVVGEAQILGQVKEAHQRARAERLISPHLDLVMREVVRAAKEIRTRTGISTRPVSIASLAADALHERFALDREAVVAVLGAGEMARKAVPALCQRLACAC
jgi:glutamyl-tRNA reductase